MRLVTTLLILTCITAYSQDTICLNPKQVENIYHGLKMYEWYKVEYPARVSDMKTLQSIVISQDTLIQGYIRRTQAADDRLYKLYQERQDLNVKLAKGWGFWDWLYFSLGCVGSGWVGYQIGK